jgi:hypothetical protein
VPAGIALCLLGLDGQITTESGDGDLADAEAAERLAAQVRERESLAQLALLSRGDHVDAPGAWARRPENPSKRISPCVITSSATRLSRIRWSSPVYR